MMQKEAFSLKSAVVFPVKNKVSLPAVVQPTVDLKQNSQNFPPLTAQAKDVPRVHLGFLDGLRGLAVLYVLFYHMWQSRHREMSLAGVKGLLTNWLLYGHLAVDVFIVLSGFCLMLPVARRGVLEGGVLVFFKKRARRILPPFFAAVLLAVAVNAATFALYSHGHVAVTSPKTILANLLLLQDVHPACNNINAAFWSVAVEWKIYFLFPLLVWAWRRCGTGVALAVSIGIGYGLAGAGYLVSKHPHAGLTLVCPWYVALFGLGMWASARAFGPRPLAQFSANWKMGAVASLLLLAGLLAMFPNQGGNTNFTAHWPLTDAAVGLVAALTLLWLGMNSRDGKTTLPHRVLSWRPLTFVGSFAYSIYLVHFPVLRYYMALIPIAVQYAVPHGVINLCLAVVGLPFILLVSYGFFLAFERPFMHNAPRGQRQAEKFTTKRRVLVPAFAPPRGQSLGEAAPAFLADV